MKVLSEIWDIEQSVQITWFSHRIDLKHVKSRFVNIPTVIPIGFTLKTSRYTVCVKFLVESTFAWIYPIKVPIQHQDLF